MNHLLFIHQESGPDEHHDHADVQPANLVETLRSQTIDTVATK